MTFSRAFLAGAAALFLSHSFALAGDDNHAGHSAASHGEHKSHGLEISAAWTRATVKTAKVGGGYIQIKNTGSEPDRLIAAMADFASKVEIHEMKLVDDVMRMRPLPEGLEVPAGGELVLKPGGEHLMFMGLKKQLVEDNTANVVLVFEKAGKIDVTFKVNGLAAKSAGEDHANHGSHHSGKHGDSHKAKHEDDHGDHSTHTH